MATLLFCCGFLVGMPWPRSIAGVGVRRAELAGQQFFEVTGFGLSMVGVLLIAVTAAWRRSPSAWPTNWSTSAASWRR